MWAHERCPDPLLKSDPVALIGVVARPHGGSLSQQLDPVLEAAPGSRLQPDGTADIADAPGLQAALTGLDDRLREALGE